MAEEEIEINATGQEQEEDDGAQHAQLVIRRQLPNKRIDKYLQHRFPDFSRAMIQRLIREEAVTVNGKTTKSSYNLKQGDNVDLILPPLPEREIEPEPIPLEVNYEDEHMLAINKQKNLVVHPARGNRGGTLVNGLVHYSNELSRVNGEFRPGIVHRLDRDTTGVIVVAKTDTAHWRLAHQFEHRLTRKVYIAVVQGTMDLDADVISVALGRHPRAREKYAARPESGKVAETRYQLERQYRGYAVLRLMPKTGRTHQLRVHMSYIKHPIVGDIMYGGKRVTIGQLASQGAGNVAKWWEEEYKGRKKECDETTEAGQGGGSEFDEQAIDRQALHAAELYLNHPISGKEMCIKAPLPEDMNRLIELLERYRRGS